MICEQSEGCEQTKRRGQFRARQHYQKTADQGTSEQSAPEGEDQQIRSGANGSMRAAGWQPSTLVPTSEEDSGWPSPHVQVGRMVGWAVVSPQHILWLDVKVAHACCVHLPQGAEHRSHYSRALLVGRLAHDQTGQVARAFWRQEEVDVVAKPFGGGEGEGRWREGRRMGESWSSWRTSSVLAGRNDGSRTSTND